MAVSQTPAVYQVSPTLVVHKRSLSSMPPSQIHNSYKWIDEELYRTTVLSLYPPATEKEADETLQNSARDLGLLPVQTSPQVETLAASFSATTIASENAQGSIISQSTAPTSCASSDRRPSTSLSNRSTRNGSKVEMPAIVTEMERKRHSGFKSGLRKMTGFRKKKVASSSTPSMTSLQSHMTSNTTNESTRSPAQGTASIESTDSYSSRESPVAVQTFEPESLIDQQALQRSLECDQIVRIRTQQLEEKRRFLEYQNRIIRQLLDERDKLKNEKRERHQKRVEEQEEKNEKAVETLEARQLEEELKQLKEHEGEKRAIETRLRHMEAYCQNPSPPTSPATLSFDLRPSDESVISLPERHITTQHYENLAQAYHVRDNMDDLHASKITVLRGKQKRALQNFMLKKQREITQMDKENQKELNAIDLEYRKQEAEVREEFEMKRTKLEARWKLQSLIERTRMERSTGLKYEGLPDIVAAEA